MILKIIATIVLGLALLGCGSFGTLFAFWAVMSEGSDKQEFSHVASVLWRFALLFTCLLLIPVWVSLYGP